MAANTDFNIRLRVQAEQAAAAFRQIQNLAANTAGQIEKSMERSSSKVRSAFTGLANGIKGAFTGIPGLLASLGAGLSVGALISVNREFARLGASLQTVTGSASAGKQAFAELEDFAARTPFSVQELTEAFVRLKSLGLDATIGSLESYGNTASATGKSLMQFTEAVADAITGEFERLKEFGIKSEAQGNKVSFTFRGITTTVAKNAAEIEGYLKKIGQTDFAGAMETRAATLDGALSNLGDSFSRLAREIGESGVNDAISAFARSISGAIDAVSRWLDSTQDISRRTDVKGLTDQLSALRTEEERLARVSSAPRTKSGIQGAQQETQRRKAAEDLGKVRFDIAEVEQRLLDLQPAAKKAGDAVAAGLAKAGASAQESAKAIAKLQEALKGTRDAITAQPEKADEEVSILDFAGAITKARSAFAAGDSEKAIKNADQARLLIEQMAKAGRESDLVLGGLTAQVEQLGTRIADRLAGKSVEIPITTTYDQALAELPAVRDRIQSAASANPIRVPVYAEIVLPDGSTYSAGGQTSGDVAKTLADEALKRGARK